MRVYWDSSALVVAVLDGGVRKRLSGDDSWARVHVLAEVFSTLTGGRLGFRVDAADAAAVIDEMRGSLKFVELSDDDVMAALRDARRLGVRGGRVHDYLHAMAAKAAGCGALRTLNTGDFVGLCGEVELREP